MSKKTSNMKKNFRLLIKKFLEGRTAITPITFFCISAKALFAEMNTLTSINSVSYTNHLKILSSQVSIERNF